MKYVLVTGGVVSGLGKGVTASSIGVVLKACGLRVTSIKIGLFLPRFLRIFFLLFLCIRFLFLFLGFVWARLDASRHPSLCFSGTDIGSLIVQWKTRTALYWMLFFPPGMQWMFGHPNGE